MSMAIMFCDHGFPWVWRSWFSMSMVIMALTAGCCLMVKHGSTKHAMVLQGHHGKLWFVTDRKYCRQKLGQHMPGSYISPISIQEISKPNNSTKPTDHLDTSSTQQKCAKYVLETFGGEREVILYLETFSRGRLNICIKCLTKVWNIVKCLC